MLQLHLICQLISDNIQVRIYIQKGQIFMKPIYQFSRLAYGTRNFFRK